MVSSVPSKRELPHSPPPAASSSSTSTTPAPPTPSSTAVEEATDGMEGFTKILSRDEKRKLRKVEKNRPSFAFDVGQFRQGRKIGTAHVRELVLYLTADGPKPNWIVAEHKTNISHTVLLLIPGLLPSHLGLDIPLAANQPFPTSPVYPPTAERPMNRVPYLAKMFAYGVPVRAPGDNRRMFSVMSTLLNSPLPDSVRKKKEEEDKRIAELAKTDDAPPFLYLLTPNQMIDNDYKLPAYTSSGDSVDIPGLEKSQLPKELAKVAVGENGKADDLVEGLTVDTVRPAVNGRPLPEWWAETREAEGPPADGRYPVLAMDCEMVETTKGNELARISIIDYTTGSAVFDHLVLPPDPVKDYRTKWSGMTKERLASATHTVATIQAALLTSPSPIITPHTILLGHSLECDLNALRIRHPLCVDTALLFKHPRGAPYKPALKWLANKWLGREIQNQAGGHDSAEDARTCVDLLKLKVANGPDFGAFNDTTEPIFERINRYSLPAASATAPPNPPQTSAVCDYSNPKSGHGSKATTAVKCNDDDEILNAIIEHVDKHDLVFGRMMELANVQGWNGGNLPDPSICDSSSEPIDYLPSALASLNSRLSKLHAALPRNTALILLTGHSDPKPMLELSAKRQKWERLVKELGGSDGVKGDDRWLAEDDREMEMRVAEAREGMGFFCVK